MQRTWGLSIGLVLAVTPLTQAEWRLAWADEFERDGLPDSARWTYEVGVIRNREAQYYTHARAENARVEGGRLVIEARREPWQGREWTSASLITLGRMHVRHGRIVIRAKLPSGRGTWPALWTMGVHDPMLPWPRRGEIDIMEMVGFEPDVIHTTIHTEKYNHRRGTHRSAKFTLPGASTAFHDYAVNVRPDRVEFEVDGEQRFVYTKEPGAGLEAWPFDAPQYLLMNIAIGGNWGGQRGIDPELKSARMEVEFVRVYTDPAVPTSEVIRPAQQR
ncbi:MAG: glycoside hydrolase family 16 protein [Kiritimatiellae bacterium]|nr:glycoside hydrolase family 16 protein [Kiritimatiellia bacterium]